jgi:hypothetical protein
MGIPFVGRELANVHLGDDLAERRRPAPRRLPPLVLELFSRREISMDGRLGSTQSVPFPIFDTTLYRTGVLTVLVHAKSGFGTGTSVHVWIQDAVQVPDDPAVLFADDRASATIDDATPAPSLKTVDWTLVGPSARLRIEWLQATAELSAAAKCTLSAYVTLRPG